MIRCFLAFCLGLLVIEGVAGDEKADELKKFQGHWRIIQAQRGADEITKHILNIEFNGTTKITENALCGPLEKNKFSIDATKKPRQIDEHAFATKILVDPKKGKIESVFPITFRGIYEFHGNRLRICITIDPNGDRPTEFRATKENKGTKETLLLVLEKRK